MPILQGDVKLVASQVMDDVPEGGGAPTSVVIQDGQSNTVFKDISESDRSAGRINLAKVNVSIQTDDRDTYLGGNVIVAEPPDDPNVSITLFKATTPFDRRTDAEDQVEAYLVPGPTWGGYLLENHVAGQRAIQLFQRPGSSTPPIGRTLVLTINEGLSNQVRQYVRVTNVETETRMFSQIIGGTLVDFQGMVVVCDISDRLLYDFAGSPPDRTFAAASGKTITRDTTVADAGQYFGVSPLANPLSIGDVAGQVESVYTQLVPNARTEVVALDQRPSAERQITLATAPRAVTVGAAPHSMRVKVSAENRGFSYVQILTPFPAANTVTVSFRALNTWYSITDDGNGTFTGTGVGTVNYTNGTISVTFPSMPDVGSSVVFTWGEKAGFNDRSASVAFRIPETTVQLQNTGVVPGSFSATWQSGGVTKTATANSAGAISGDATGSINYQAGSVTLRPTSMIDPGGEYSFEYDYQAEQVDWFPSVSVDAAGLAALTLSQTPVSGTLAVRWVTARTVSGTAGATTGVNTDKGVTSKVTQVSSSAQIDVHDLDYYTTP